MATIRLVHWHEDEGLERQQQLEALGFQAAFDFGDGVFAMRQIRASHPDAVVIDLTRMPSHGREVAHGVRSAKATRNRWRALARRHRHHKFDRPIGDQAGRFGSPAGLEIAPA